MLITDGAYGTALQPHLQHGEIADELCRRAPARVVEQHIAYIEAGAEAIQTNSFMAWALPSARGRVVYQAAIDCAREAVEGRTTEGRTTEGRAGEGKAVSIRGTIGPAGKHARNFYRPVELMLEQGLEHVICETVTDLDTASAFIKAWHEVSRGVHATAILSCSINASAPLQTWRWIQRLTLPERLELGLNCCAGPEPALRDPLEALCEYELPIHFAPSAGLPTRQSDGSLAYPFEPQQWAQAVAELTDELPVASTGGCCGTSPAMIAALAETR